MRYFYGRRSSLLVIFMFMCTLVSFVPARAAEPTDRSSTQRLAAALRAASGQAGALAIGPAATPPPADQCVPDSQGRCRNEILVSLADTSVLTLLTTLLPLRLLDQLGTLPIYRLQITSPLSTIDALLTTLLANPLVRLAEPNYIGGTPESRRSRSSWSSGGSESAFYGQWAPALMRLPEAHAISRGAGVTVAVLDTGVDSNHPALAGHLVPGIDFVDGDFDPAEVGTHGQDLGFGHGTHVAGLVALAAPDAQIMPVRILRPDGTGNSWLLAQAMRYVVATGADVINISYSVPQRSFLVEDLLGQLSSTLTGAVVVAAAGNNGPSTDREYPAGENSSGTLAVGASTISDTLATFSTRGTWVDVVAPGEHIISSVPDDTYGTWSGTSMASPLAAGTAALVRANEPGLTPAQVVQRLVTTAATISGPVPRRIDAAAALEVQITSPTTSPKRPRIRLPSVLR